MSLILTTILRNEKGEEVKRVSRPSHSYVQQFLKLLMVLWSAKTASVTDITNTARTIGYSGAGRFDIFFDGVPENLNSSSYGIVVGSGLSAESNANYKLDTLITHGEGIGQLYYRSMLFWGEIEPQWPHYNPPYYEVHIRRLFDNRSGGIISISEVGWYLQSKDTAGTSRTFLIMRDLESNSVASGYTLEVIYTLRIEY